MRIPFRRDGAMNTLSTSLGLADVHAAGKQHCSDLSELCLACSVETVLGHGLDNNSEGAD